MFELEIELVNDKGITISKQKASTIIEAVDKAFESVDEDCALVSVSHKGNQLLDAEEYAQYITQIPKASEKLTKACINAFYKGGDNYGEIPIGTVVNFHKRDPEFYGDQQEYPYVATVLLVQPDGWTCTSGIGIKKDENHLYFYSCKPSGDISAEGIPEFN